MKTLKKVFKFYINSSIHVALAMISLVKITFIKFDILGADTYLYFGFFGSIISYNFVKYSSSANLYHRRLTKSMNTIKVFTGISCVILIYLALQLSTDVLFYLFPFFLLTILYAIPIFPKKKNLRSVAGIKIFIIALLWAGTTMLIPISFIEGQLDFDMIIELIQRFLFVIVMMLPFEIRDLQYDANELGTVPQIIGITRTKIFGSILLVFFLILTVFKDEISSVEILSTIVVTIISLLFLWGTEKKQSEYFCSFWVESIPIMWLLILIVLQNLL